jgi:hypothetical protein
LAANQLRCKLWQSIVSVVGPAEFAFCVATVGVTGFVQGPPKGAEPPSVGLRRPTAKKSDNGSYRPLGARRERPRNGNTTKTSDEFSPPHGIFPLAENHLVVNLIRSLSENYAPQDWSIDVAYGSKADMLL